MQRACMGTTKSAGSVGLAGTAKSVGTAAHAGTAQSPMYIQAVLSVILTVVPHQHI